jgi:predicted ArsR family transcriptional regulator
VVADTLIGDILGPVSTDRAISAVASLDDDLRRGMFDFIRAARHPVTRDEAAAAVGISRKLAAFHLDKLVDAGLLRAHYEGVGRVGRAPKVYEPTDVDVRVSIPARQYDLLADILVDAVLADDARGSAETIAAERGRAIGSAEREEERPGRLGVERALTMTCRVLAKHGFEPQRDTPTTVQLRDCPFHPIAARARGLVCGINRAFLAGVLEGLEARSVEAVLAPGSGGCCVVLQPQHEQG